MRPELSVPSWKLPSTEVPWGEEAALPFLSGLLGVQGMQLHTQALGLADSEEGSQLGAGAISPGH